MPAVAATVPAAYRNERRGTSFDSSIAVGSSYGLKSFSRLHRNPSRGDEQTPAVKASSRLFASLLENNSRLNRLRFRNRMLLAVFPEVALFEKSPRELNGPRVGDEERM